MKKKCQEKRLLLLKDRRRSNPCLKWGWLVGWLISFRVASCGEESIDVSGSGGCIGIVIIII